jgi:anti-sigma factor RsiW
MTEHLSTAELNGVIDGELERADLVRAGEHLSACLACSSQALSLGILKRRVADAGAAFPLPQRFEQRMRNAIAGPAVPEHGRKTWLPIAAAVALCAAMVPVQQVLQRRTERAAVVTQLVDQHIATLAAGAPPQVISSDRHTVKPWFQGKLPFSFNLPASLPAGTTLDGANLVYLHGHPAAQLLFSIGKHRASVFVEQRGASATLLDTTRAGFHVEEFHTAELQGIAVSDTDPAALKALIASLRNAQ